MMAQIIRAVLLARATAARLDAVGIRFGERHVVLEAGIGDEHRNVASGGTPLCHNNIVMACQIRRDNPGAGTKLCDDAGQFLQPLATTRNQNQIIAFSGQALGEGAADAG